MYLPTSKGPSRVKAITQIDASYGINTAVPGAINTKGAWTEIYSSSEFATQGVLLNVRAADFGVAYLVDIGVGGSGSEEVIIPDVFIFSDNSTPCTGVYIPMRIPAGTRISARAAMSSLAGFGLVAVQLLLIGEDMQWDRVPRIPRATAFGANAATSRGATLTSGGGADVKGSWVELSTATPHPIHWVVIQFGCDNKGAGFDGTFDIGVGAGGSEKVLLPDFAYTAMAPAGDIVLPPYVSIPTYIPAGVRLAARLAANLASQTLDIVVLGVSE